MLRELPTCFGCGAAGVYSICQDCMVPETRWEDHNRSVPRQSHNLYNYPDW